MIPVEISGHFPESLGNAGQDTKRRKSKKLFAIRCDSDLEKRNRKINRRNSIAAGKYEIVYGVYPNWNKYGAEELGQMAAEIIRAGK